MTRGQFLLVAVLLAGCGDNEPLCTYREAADATNDQLAEPSGQHAGAQAIGLCGTIDSGHFDPKFKTVDVDTFQVTVEGSGDLAIELVAEPGVELLDDLAVAIFTADPNPTLIAAGRFDTTLADHGAFHTQLPPADYQIVVTALARGDISGTLGYRVELIPDPVARCPAASGAADYTEAADGAGSTDNDAFEVDFTKTPAFTSVAGTPEPTTMVVDDESSAHLAGTSTKTTATAVHVDEYLDRDTYEIATSDRTNELTVRVDWTDPAADLDLVVFEEATLAPVVVSNVTSSTAPELAVFAVKPDTRYLVWVGSFLGSSGSTPYDITLCGAHFVN